MNCKRFPLQKPFPTLCLWKTISDKNWTGYKSLSEKQITRSFLFQQQLSVLEPVHATSCMARSWPYGHGLHVDVMTQNMTAFSEMFILPCNPQKKSIQRKSQDESLNQLQKRIWLLHSFVTLADGVLSAPDPSSVLSLLPGIGLWALCMVSSEKQNNFTQCKLEMKAKWLIETLEKETKHVSCNCHCPSSVHLTRCLPLDAWSSSLWDSSAGHATLDMWHETVTTFETLTSHDWHVVNMNMHKLSSKHALNCCTQVTVKVK